MASIKQFIERRDNIAAIVAYVRSVGKATRIEISSALSLSWACVSDLVALLIERGVIVESYEREKSALSVSRGRTPTYLSLNEKKYFLGVDINDSGVAITILSMNGTKIKSKKWNAETVNDENELAESVCEKIKEMLLEKEDCCGIGVAMQGVESKSGGWIYPIKDGYVRFSPDKVIKEFFDLPVYVMHDPECMIYALSENFEEDCITLRVDTGIGVAAMKRGKILELPLEIAPTRYGGKRLDSILSASIKSGTYDEFAYALGVAVGNMAIILGVKKIFIVGEIIEWFDEIASVFDSALGIFGGKIKYEVSKITDASEGAAKVAMSEYPDLDIT